MDNLTHSLVGFASAEMLGVGKETNPRVRLTGYLLALFTNNAPDLDLLYTQITAGKLGYLLHHRGHTHTLIGTIFLSLLMVAIALGCLQWRGERLTGRQGRLLAAVALVGGLLHLFLDSWNLYGVHPFWPMTNRWYYGDSIFIVEPLIWVMLLPLVWGSSLPRKVRILSVGGCLAILGVIAWTPLLLSGMRPLLIAVPILLFLALRRWPYRPVLRGTLALLAVALVGYGLLSRHLSAVTAREFTEVTVDDVILSPLPSNPFCWTVLVAFHDDRTDELGLRRGLLTPWSQWVGETHCPRVRSAETLAPLRGLAEASKEPFHWMGELRYPRREFIELAQTNCQFAELLRFARAPYYRQEGDQVLIGDLRFAWGKTPGFAEMNVPTSPAACPQSVPPWEPPRASWLKAGS